MTWQWSADISTPQANYLNSGVGSKERHEFRLPNYRTHTHACGLFHALSGTMMRRKQPSHLSSVVEEQVLLWLPRHMENRGTMVGGATGTSWMQLADWSAVTTCSSFMGVIKPTPICYPLTSGVWGSRTLAFSFIREFSLENLTSNMRVSSERGLSTAIH